MTNTTPPRRLHALSGEPEWSVLDRYFSNECTPDEAEAVTRWIAADASHAELLAFLRQIWTEGGIVRPKIDEAADWRALQARIAAEPRGPAPTRALRVAPLTIARGPRRAPRFSRRVSVAVAAAGLAAAVTLAAVWGTNRTLRPAGMPAGTGREYVTERGQRAKVMLVDGTRVWLSVASRLHVPASYGTRTRDVELEGQAFFAVQHDDEHPFRVHTRGAVSEDLGTEFSVRAYPGDSATIVVVADGVVALRRSEPERAVAGATERGVELTRAQMGRLDSSGRVTVVNGVDLRAFLGWREGALEFQEMPLADAVRELERWYDVDITLDDSSLARVPVTATFDDQTVDQALAIIAGALDVGYRRQGREVRLTTGPARR